jgi:EamA domain-containing membrane protein RarD
MAAKSQLTAAGNVMLCVPMLAAGMFCGFAQHAPDPTRSPFQLVACGLIFVGMVACTVVGTKRIRLSILALMDLSLGAIWLLVAVL